jgi:hypothetical protein
MPDPEFIHARPADALGAVAATSSLPPFPRVTCRKCNADLSFLPTAARFCNRCGVRLSGETYSIRPGPARRGGVPPSGPLFSRPRWLFNLWFACVDQACKGNPSGAHSAHAGRSSMLLAYGKSLFNLGWRYEHAVGARRNLTEAARCYCKAARLGDPSATGRLGPAARAPVDPAPSRPRPHPVPRWPCLSPSCIGPLEPASITLVP